MPLRHVGTHTFTPVKEFRFPRNRGLGRQ